MTRKLLGRIICWIGFAVWLSAGALSLVGAPIWKFWYVAPGAVDFLLVGLALIFVGGIVDGDFWDIGSER